MRLLMHFRPNLNPLLVGEIEERARYWFQGFKTISAVCKEKSQKVITMNDKR